MLPCHNLWDLEEQRGRGFLNLSYGGKGKSHKQEELLWGAIKKLPKELTTELLYLELPTISASCGVKRYMYYIRFLLTNKTSQAITDFSIRIFQKFDRLKQSQIP